MKRPIVRDLAPAELKRLLLHSCNIALDSIADPATDAYEIEMSLMDLAMDILRVVYGTEIDAYIRHLENSKDD